MHGTSPRGEYSNDQWGLRSSAFVNQAIPAGAYQEMMDSQMRMQDKLAAQRGFDDFEVGRHEPAEAVFKRLKKKNGF